MLSLDAVLSLRDRAERNRTDLFLAEGVRFLMAARDARAEIVGLVISDRLLPSLVAARTVRRLENAGVPTLRVSEVEFLSFSQAAEPQGVALVAQQKWERLIEQKPAPGSLWVALDRVRSPGNLGTILRTCAAVGADGVMLIGGETDPYDPKAVRASMGAIFGPKLVRTSAKALSAWKERHRCIVVGASLDGQRDYRAFSYRRPVVLMMGSEREGLRPRQEALCDELVRIPMVGQLDSLNLAVATSLMLYEAWGQRNPVRLMGDS